MARTAGRFTKSAIIQEVDTPPGAASYELRAAGRADFATPPAQPFSAISRRRHLSHAARVEAEMANRGLPRYEAATYDGIRRVT